MGHAPGLCWGGTIWWINGSRMSCCIMSSISMNSTAGFMVEMFACLIIYHSQIRPMIVNELP